MHWRFVIILMLTLHPALSLGGALCGEAIGIPEAERSCCCCDDQCPSGCPCLVSEDSVPTPLTDQPATLPTSDQLLVLSGQQIIDIEPLDRSTAPRSIGQILPASSSDGSFRARIGIWRT